MSALLASKTKAMEEIYLFIALVVFSLIIQFLSRDDEILLHIPRYHFVRIQYHRNPKPDMVEFGHHGGQKAISSDFKVWIWWLVHI